LFFITNTIVSGCVGLVGLGLVELVADLGPWEKVAVGAVGVIVGLFALDFFDRRRRKREAQRQATLAKQIEEEQRRAELAKYTEEARFLLREAKLAPSQMFLRVETLGAIQISINHYAVQIVRGADERREAEFMAFDSALRFLLDRRMIEVVNKSRGGETYKMTPAGWDFQPKVAPSKQPSQWSIVSDDSKGRRGEDGRVR
jgi:hypothetical protein